MPTTVVSFGDLDNLASTGYTQLTIEACNAGGCAEGGVGVNRWNSQDSSSGDLMIVYHDWGINLDGFPTLVVKNAFYTRQLKGRAFRTEYSIVTTGERNGEVLHLGSVDSLLWNEFSTPPPIWGAFYYTYPWWGYVQPNDEEHRGGCTAAAWTFAHESSLCADIAEYAANGNASAYADVVDTSLGSVGLPESRVGAVTLWVRP